MNRILAEEWGWDYRGIFMLNLRKDSDTSYYGECGKCSGRLNQVLYGYAGTAPLKFFAKTSEEPGLMYDSENFGPVGSVFTWTSTPIAISGTISLNAPIAEWPYSSHLYDDNYNAGVRLTGLWAIDLTGRSYYDAQ